jgi:hypothetical protein
MTAIGPTVKQQLGGRGTVLEPYTPLRPLPGGVIDLDRFRVRRRDS